MKKKKNEPIEELTTAMHETFTISKEKDREFRVWAAVRALNKTGWPLERILYSWEITAEEFEKYKDTQPK